MSSSKLSEEKHDWYAILGCTSESSKSAIERAARKLFLKYHPDKTTDPKAPELFLLVQKAKEILLDDEKRKVIDEAKRAVAKREEYDQQRSKGMDVRRKRMREELEEKLGAVAKPSASSVPSSSSGGATNKSSSVDLERLRKEGASLREASAREAVLREAQRVYEFAEKKKIAEHEQWLKSAANQIKVKWKRSRQNHSDDSLYQLFKSFGSIEAVTLVGDKGNAALITFTEHGPANLAVDAYAASTEYRVTLPADDAAEGKKRAAIFTHIYSDKAAGSATQNGPEIIGVSHGASSNESDLMREMRRAVEREQLIRALGKDDDGADAATHPISTGAGATATFATAPSAAGSESAMGTANTASRIDTTGTTAITFAAKEADILQRMMEAAKMKKMQLQETAIKPS